MEYPPITDVQDYMPPNDPWKELDVENPERGYLSYYYSDEELSSLPVREVTRPNDNKGDPNLETMTYGVCSTCQRQLRAGVVKNGIRHLFFLTRWRSARHLTGYYRIGWFTKGAPQPSFIQDGRILDDFLLCASQMKFIDPPIPLSALEERFEGAQLNTGFRNRKKLDAELTESLLEVLEEHPDKSQEYIREIRRLEKVNRRYHEFSYTNWEQEEPFSWENIDEYVQPDQAVDEEELTEALETVSTQEASNWMCIGCGHVHESESALKKCRECGTIGSLIPSGEE